MSVQMEKHNDELIKPQSTTDLSKEMSLTKDDKIHAFDFLSWASLAATIISGWQIIIPFLLFSLNSAQVFLAITSIFFLIVSLIMLYWSNKNYQFLKKTDKTAEEQKLEKDDNPQLQTWHIEGTIYVISFILIACYSTIIIGILLFEGYSWAILVAKGIDTVTAQREAQIIIVSESALIVSNIVILIFYIKYSYHLEFYPKHLPSILGFILSALITMCCMTAGDQHYLKSYIGASSPYFVHIAEDVHTQITWTCIIGIFGTFIFMIINRNIQQEQTPNVRFYFLPFLFFIGLGFFLAINSLKFLYYAKDVNGRMRSNCKDTLQTFSQNYISTIGCPSKYQIFYENNNLYYDLNCDSSSTGLVWELDIGKKNNEKQNQISCLNLNCCYLVAEKRSLNYKEFFLFSMMTAFIGWIAAGHCFDLALQNPNKIKAGPSIYATPKFAAQIIISLLAAVIAIFFAIQYRPVVPQIQPNIQASSRMVMKINHNFTTYPLLNQLQSVSQCIRPTKAATEQLKVEFDKKKCNESIIGNPTICNKKIQGFYVCLFSQNGVFQLDSSWDSQHARIIGLSFFDPYVLAQGLRGFQTQDQFCMMGLDEPINKIISSMLYVCQNPNKTVKVTMKSKQIETNFQYSIPKEEQIKDPSKRSSHLTKHFPSFEQFDQLKTITLTFNQNVQETEQSNQNEKNPENKYQATQQYTPTNQTETNEEQGTFKVPINLKYTFVALQIYDAETYQPIPQAIVNLYLNIEKCTLFDTSINYAIRTLHSDRNGTAIINNLQLEPNDSYLFQVRADGYLFNCIVAKKLKQDSLNTYYIPLVTNLKPTENMKVLLWHQKLNLNLQLGATIELNEKYQCTVGYFNSHCGGLIHSSTEKGHQGPSNVITVNLIGMYHYLFYVRLIPLEPDIKNIINNPGLHLKENQQKILAEENQNFLESKAFVNVYVQDIQYPVSTYPLPIGAKQIQEFKSSPVLVTWLAICMNGKIGVTSQQPINHFWAITSNENLTYWQKSASSPQSQPDASICKEFFKESDTFSEQN